MKRHELFPGRVSKEELTQLSEALPGGMQMAAKAMDKTVPDFIEMVENGDVLTNDLMPLVATEMMEAAQIKAQITDQDITASINLIQNATAAIQDRN